MMVEIVGAGWFEMCAQTLRDLLDRAENNLPFVLINGKNDQKVPSVENFFVVRSRTGRFPASRACTGHR
jgi:hypothetical protein